jgi:transcriptional regulator with XRE-family HTH domain
MLSSVDFNTAMVRGPIHPDSKQALAERLYLLRTAKGWTQAFAAKIIGEQQATWGFWESPNNIRKPTAAQLVKIEIATGAPREWIQSGIASRMSQSLTEALADASERLDRGQGPPKRKRRP